MARHNELERRSDELLIDGEQGRREYPCHTERWMEILGRRERPGIERVPAPAGEIEAKLAGMVVDAQLTRRQRMVVRWLARGQSQTRRCWDPERRSVRRARRSRGCGGRGWRRDRALSGR